MFSSGVNAHQKGLTKLETGHPPAESGFKTKSKNDGTIGISFLSSSHQKKMSHISAILLKHINPIDLLVIRNYKRYMHIFAMTN